MPEDNKNKPSNSGQQPARKPDEDPVGKVYDSGLARRLARYLLPYWFQAAISAIAVSIKSLGDIAGPFLVMVGIDHYFPRGPEAHSVAGAGYGFISTAWLTRRLAADPAPGITQLAAIYLALQISSYLFEFIQ